jgi:hypothetical protein
MHFYAGPPMHFLSGVDTYDMTKSVSMTDTDKILHALAEMQKDIHSLKEGQATLQGDVKSLKPDLNSA